MQLLLQSLQENTCSIKSRYILKNNTGSRYLKNKKELQIVETKKPSVVKPSLQNWISTWALRKNLHKFTPTLKVHGGQVTHPKSMYIRHWAKVRLSLKHVLRGSASQLLNPAITYSDIKKIWKTIYYSILKSNEKSKNLKPRVEVKISDFHAARFIHMNVKALTLINID